MLCDCVLALKRINKHSKSLFLKDRLKQNGRVKMSPSARLRLFSWGEKKTQRKDVSTSRSRPEKKRPSAHRPSLSPCVPPGVRARVASVDRSCPPACRRIKDEQRQQKPGMAEERRPNESPVHARTPPLCHFFFLPHPAHNK